MYSLVIRNTETGERKVVDVPFKFEIGETLYTAEIVDEDEKVNEYEVEYVFEIERKVKQALWTK